MYIELAALQNEISAIAGLGVSDICGRLAMLGFPVDNVCAGSGATILEVDVTANRGDALSHRGLARDLAAVLDAPLTPISVVPTIVEGEALLSIRLETEACPIYATALMELDCATPGQTPIEAVAFLAAMGSVAKGLVPVDASNELLHRYGHPTHAFDADKLCGEVCVRWAKRGETLLTLDGVLRTLDSKDMVIADDSGPIALAGVIGGDPTKVTENTKRVLLESAFFDPRTVRASAHRHGIHSDASHRFGRGADIAFAKTARDLLVKRLMEWGKAELLGSWTVGHCSMPPPAVLLRSELLNRIAGEPIQLGEAKKILLGLGCKVELSDAGLNIQPPSWRHDLGIAEDYAEEVLRIRGFDRIGSELPLMEGAPSPLPLPYLQSRHISRRLAQLGFYQTVTLGFISPEADSEYSKKDLGGRVLANPLGIDYSVMRGSLIPSLWEVAQANLRHGAKDIRIFEIAPVYESAPKGPSEATVLCIVWAGALGGEDPLTPARTVMAADLLALARDLGSVDNVSVIELDQNAFCLEIPLNALAGPTEQVIPSFRPYSRYPMATRDLSLLVPLGLSYGELETAILRSIGHTPLHDIRCIDVYKDRALITDNKQAWLLRLRFQAMDRTLTGEEVEAWINVAIDAAKQHNCLLRG